MLESEDHVEVGGVVFNKPFVEKPVSAEDHNIYIYYPTSAGGGSQRLFRKIGSRSSVYSPESRVRKSGMSDNNSSRLSMPLIYDINL